jgi:hypothetical protein
VCFSGRFCHWRFTGLQPLPPAQGIITSALVNTVNWQRNRPLTMFM